MDWAGRSPGVELGGAGGPPNAQGQSKTAELDVRHGCTLGHQVDRKMKQMDPKVIPNMIPNMVPKKVPNMKSPLLSAYIQLDRPGMLLKFFFGRFEYIATSRIWPPALLSIKGGGAV